VSSSGCVGGRVLLTTSSQRLAASLNKQRSAVLTYIESDFSYYIICQGRLSKGDLLLSKLSRVLLRNVECVELIKLLLFNSLDLATLFIDLLADLAALLKVVKTVLLRLLVVSMDLGTQLL
jgi:hypothetical protein